MQINATRWQYDSPAPGTTSGAHEIRLVVAPAGTARRRPDEGAARQARLPVVRMVEGTLVEKYLNADTAWPAVRRSTALRGRIIPAPGEQPGEDRRSRNAISAYSEIHSAVGRTGIQGSFLNHYA